MTEASNANQNPAGEQSRRNGRSTRRHRHANKSRRCEKRLLHLKLVAGAVGVLFLILMVLMKFEIQELTTAKNQLTVKSRKLAQELQQANQKLHTLRIEVDEMVLGRIPGLGVLEFDKTFPIDKHFIRNIIFTLTGVGDDKKYEYRLVMHNDSMNIVHPKARILLFDELGIQLGSAEISSSAATAEAEYYDLKPGETRSYSAMVPLQRANQPRFFLLVQE